ncbi:hypothetical protein [Ohtaekwangia koreensis]|uniref:Uncharacterized protein n=1 Tax=Ohtaekwangia koreensis TaxID=688867 RepID=A0A1T5LA63_9BACT|nr:hypothetical protein [Ohtaekwangia koreensis]SKC72871.1 hypothetical protein SAMN05660236_2824 [Ohtaekwangia koreensis]
MADFEKLQSLWNKQEPAVVIPAIESLKEENKTAKDKLMQAMFFRGTVLAITGIVVLYFLFSDGFGIASTLSFISVAGLGMLCLLQGIVELYAGRKLLKIEPLQEPTVHIHAWENYFELRRRMLAVSGPVYFVSFNLFMVLFFLEALQTYTIAQRVSIFIGYGAWVIFGWFVVRKRTTKKEEQRVIATIENLKRIQGALN